MRHFEVKPPIGRLHVLHVVAWTLVTLFAIEVTAQVREHLRTGQSIVNRLVQDVPDFVFDERIGLRLLRPNAVIRGQQQEMRSNSLGLRSDELPAIKLPGEHRIAVVGASSVMGAYSRNNQETLPAILQVRLRAMLPGVEVEVINAGIAGYTLADQRRMLAYVTDRLAPEIVFVYPGVNDFAGYCRAAGGSTPVNPYRLPQFELPRWLMSVDLLLKNTVALRPVPKVSPKTVDARKLDLTAYRQRIDELVATAREHRAQIVLSTNARNYRPDQPLALQEERARTARYYNPCFDVPNLNVLYERHNDAIVEAGARLGAAVVPIGDIVPGGPEYFHDSVHFSAQGKDVVARAFAEYIVGHYGAVWRGGE